RRVVAPRAPLDLEEPALEDPTAAAQRAAAQQPAQHDATGGQWSCFLHGVIVAATCSRHPIGAAPSGAAPRPRDEAVRPTAWSRVTANHVAAPTSRARTPSFPVRAAAKPSAGVIDRGLAMTRLRARVGRTDPASSVTTGSAVRSWSASTGAGGGGGASPAMPDRMEKNV